MRAQVQIDYCKNCRIFVGPTESSVFIRNWSAGRSNRHYHHHTKLMIAQRGRTRTPDHAAGAA